jgi:HD-like signal output (HDOD) protein
VDHSFIAGILHDVGKSILAQHLPEVFQQALERRAGGIPQWQAEREIIGASHCQVGAYMLGLWGLPDPIVQAVALHHDPSTCTLEGFSTVTAVHVGNALLHRVETNGACASEGAVDESYVTDLGLADRLPIWEECCRKTAKEGVGR